MAEQNNKVVHLPDRNMFILEIEPGLSSPELSSRGLSSPGQAYLGQAFLEYELAGDGTFMIMHTEVPEAHSGKGYASSLAKAALQYVEEQGLKVMPYCTYMAAYLRRNQERYQPLVSPEFSF